MTLHRSTRWYKRVGLCIVLASACEQKPGTTAPPANSTALPTLEPNAADKPSVVPPPRDARPVAPPGEWSRGGTLENWFITRPANEKAKPTPTKAAQLLKDGLTREVLVVGKGAKLQAGDIAELRQLGWTDTGTIYLNTVDPKFRPDRLVLSRVEPLAPALVGQTVGSTVRIFVSGALLFSSPSKNDFVIDAEIVGRSPVTLTAPPSTPPTDAIASEGGSYEVLKQPTHEFRVADDVLSHVRIFRHVFQQDGTLVYASDAKTPDEWTLDRLPPRELKLLRKMAVGERRRIWFMGTSPAVVELELDDVSSLPN